LFRLLFLFSFFLFFSFLFFSFFYWQTPAGGAAAPTDSSGRPRRALRRPARFSDDHFESTLFDSDPDAEPEALAAEPEALAAESQGLSATETPAAVAAAAAASDDGGDDDDDDDDNDGDYVAGDDDGARSFDDDGDDGDDDGDDGDDDDGDDGDDDGDDNGDDQTADAAFRPQVRCSSFLLFFFSFFWLCGSNAQRNARRLAPFFCGRFHSTPQCPIFVFVLFCFVLFCFVLFCFFFASSLKPMRHFRWMTLR
jgi:hypothetical protein